MAHYEMPVIIKALGNQALKSALKRHLLRLLDNNQVIFDVKNLGLRRLPQAYRVAGEKQYEGHYFLINFDGPPEGLRQAKVKLLIICVTYPSCLHIRIAKLSNATPAGSMMGGAHLARLPTPQYANSAKYVIQTTRKRSKQDMVFVHSSTWRRLYNRSPYM